MWDPIDMTVDESEEEEEVTIPTTEYRRLLPTPLPLRIRQMKRQWRQTNPGLTTSARHAYGEATTESLWKIWDAIRLEIQVNPGDKFLDWGCGAGKMLMSKQYFSPYPHIASFGVEIDEHVFERVSRHIPLLGLTNVQLLRGDAADIQNWDSVTIVMQYDGGPQSHVEEPHRSIMQCLFRTASVRIVFSTKLDVGLFHTYFDRSVTVDVTDWRVVRVHGLSFGGSKFIGYLWVRL